MHPTLFTLPGGFDLTTWGFCVMVGFLSAVWFAMRRAAKVGADPDRILDISLIALLFGLAGARAMYVVHYWQSDFADVPNKFVAIINLRSGGLEFLGGLLGSAGAVVLFLLITKQSVRLYFDIMAPGTMWGLAFGRLGCFFNGCCFGGLCAVGGAGDASNPMGVEFPYGSGPFVHQWEQREVTVPAELVCGIGLETQLLPAKALRLPVEKREQAIQAYSHANDELKAAKKVAGSDKKKIAELQQSVNQAETALLGDGLVLLTRAQGYPSRVNPDRTTSVTELEELASAFPSRPVHPAQLYSTAHAFILSALLSVIFYRRKRHGVVIGLMFLLYPFARIPLEMIRADNPHDVASLTISQSISVSIFVVAAIYLFVVYKYLPERSPAAERAAPRAG